MNNRQTRALALLAGNGAVLLFAWQFYVNVIPHIADQINLAGPMPVPIAIFYFFPLVVCTVGVLVSYSALIEASHESKSFLWLERTAAGIFVGMNLIGIFSLFMTFTGLFPPHLNH